MWAMRKGKVIPDVEGALFAIPKLRSDKVALENWYKAKTSDLQKTAFLGKT